MIVAGHLIHTGTRVVTWMDPGGYDAYRVERRFAPFTESNWERSKGVLPKDASPNRFGVRKEVLTTNELELVRGGGWPLPLLQKVVDQFVLHFDASGTSRRCFEVLHDKRCLSVHFMLDLDGTVYQTLDLKERAWHATSSNGRSVGIEIASPGAFPKDQREALDRWYEKEPSGKVRLRVPPTSPPSDFMVAGYIPRPSHPEPVTGEIQGKVVEQYDFTDAQYAALIRLTAALCKVFPHLRCDAPRDPSGKIAQAKLPEDQLKQYQGLLGHYHIQSEKVDPGPAFDWDRVIHGARRLLP